MKNSITKEEFNQLTSLLKDSRHCNKVLSVICKSVEVLLEEKGDFTCSFDAVYGNEYNYNAKKLLKELGIEVEKE